jgi:hypothetical protein
MLRPLKRAWSARPVVYGGYGEAMIILLSFAAGIGGEGKEGN